MSRVLLWNIRKLVSGDINKGILDANSVLVEDGKIAEVGVDIKTEAETVIDVNGMTVSPGLIDSHVHIALGDYTPRQNTLGFIESSVHGGVTTLISAGEVHIPGRPRDPSGAKALAILAHKAFRNFRPGGAKVHAGAVILESGLREEDFAELSEEGVWLVGEIGLGSVHKPDEAALMAEWARRQGMKVLIHTGGASVPGSTPIDADYVFKVKPSIVCHINGGPTAMSLQDIRRVVESTDTALEVVQCGNLRALIETMNVAREINALHRIIIGNDAPSGTGVIPLGVVRVVSTISSLTSIPPESALAMATGNTAEAFGLKDVGIVEKGKAADLVVMDFPIGSKASDALEALRIGDTPGIAMVMIDGEVKVLTSRITPPPSRAVTVKGATHGDSSRTH